MRDSPDTVTAQTIRDHSQFLHLLVASLIADEDAAYDVVQETWLRAIERPPKRAGALRSWLATVARRRAWVRARGETRRKRREAVAAPSELQPCAVDLKQRDATFQAVTEAVLALPARLRAVVFLRYYEGVGPSQIALRLEIPIPTVKSRMRRALELLRSRLDRDESVGPRWRSVALAMLGHANSLISKGPSSGVVAASVGGAALMATQTKVTLVTVLFCAVALLGWWIADDVGSPVESDRQRDKTVRSHPVDVVTSPPSNPDDATMSTSRFSGSKPDEVDPLKFGAAIVISGRCVRAEDHEPLPGCDISVKLAARRGASASQKRNLPAPVTTAADGTFSISLQAPPRHILFIFFSSPERVGFSTHIMSPTDAAKHDLGDIAFAKGARVAGMVVDTERQPQPNIRVKVGAKLAPFITELLNTDGSVRRAQGRFVGSTTSDGRFETPQLVPPGVWPVSAGPRTVISPNFIEIRNGERTQDDVRIVVNRLDPRAVIEGTVVDEDGMPVSGVVLRASPFGGTGSTAEGRTDANGTFRIQRQSESGGRVSLATNDLPGFEPWHDPEAIYPWGTRGIRIELRRTKTMEIRVVVATTGVPVEEFGVCCFPDPAGAALRRSSWYDLRLKGRHEDGRLRVDGIVRGRNVLLVVPTDPTLLPGPITRFEVGDAQPQALRVELHRAVPYNFVVTTIEETAVVGTQVELLESVGREPLRLGAPIHSPVEAARYLENAVEGRRWAEGTTNDAGRVTLMGPPGPTPMYVKVSGADHLDYLGEVRIDPTSRAMRVIVDVGATVLGRVRPADLAKRLAPSDGKGPSIRLGLLTGSSSKPQFRDAPEARISKDGTFRLSGVRPGTWRVFVYGFRSYGSTASISGRTYTPGLATIVVESGRTLELDLDANAILPGRLSGQLLLDGSPLPHQSFVLECRQQRDAELNLIHAFGQRATTDREGRFSVECLGGFHYRVKVEYRDQESKRQFYGDRWLSVRPGEERTVTLEVHRRSARIRILTASGSPVAKRLFIVQNHSLEIGIRTATDSDGWLVLDPCPPGPLTLQGWCAGVSERAAWKLPESERESVRIVLGPIAVGGAEPVVLKLPRDKR